MKKIYLLLSAALVISNVNAQDKSWDVEKYRGQSKSVTLELEEGTWMNLDVSPDGNEIIFDLLGDIYSMPIAGGTAKLLSGGNAWDIQPRFSPDGKYISYTSDRAGGDNIWIMNRDGSGKKQITKESFRLLNNATWMPNSEYIVARKHFTASRSLGAGEMWMYSIHGGDGIQLTKRKNDQQDAGEPNVSPDGNFLYYSEDMSGGSIFEYNKDPHGSIYAIRQLNLKTGQLTNLIQGAGGAVRPQISPDGSMMAYVKRSGLKSVLYVQNLKTGDEAPLYDELSHDQQETWAISGVYSNFAWTPDNKTLVFYAKGKIRKIDLDGLKSSVIPFQASSKQNIQEALKFDQQVFTEEFNAKMLRQMVTSPDGNTVVFNAAGYLYKQTLPNGKVERLSKGLDFEYEPNFSPDGKFVVFTTWNDELRGSVKKIDVKSGKITTLSDEKGFYYSPKFSTNGDKVVFRKGAGNNTLGYSYGRNTGVFYVSANGGAKTLIIDNGLMPQFNADDSKIFFMSRTPDGKKALKSVNLNGTGERTHFTSQYANQFVVSPDNKHVAFNELFNVYVTPMIDAGVALNASISNKSIPVAKITTEGGNYMHWGADSKSIKWSLGPQHYSMNIADAFNYDGTSPKASPVVTDVKLTLKADAPTGLIALRGARIITMKGDEVIENGTIVIDGNKIVSIGSSETVQIPQNAKIVDVNGKTIMPGMVDVHAHLRTSPDGITPQNDWSYMANLAFGVTTAHDPSTNTEMVFSQSEIIKAGRMVGPRVYSTGGSIYGADGDNKVVINSLDDALAHLKRLKSVGAFSVKSYNQPRRDQRQQILEAARMLKMIVVPEGGSNYNLNMNMIADGHTGIEHSVPVNPIYKDAVGLWKNTKVGYTPTLIVAFGGLWGENYWYDRTNVWENDKLMSFTPKSVIDSRSRRRTTAEYGDYNHINVAKSAKLFSDNGTPVNLGAHGQVQGLGAHWELWMMAQGGFSPLESIRVATLNGAKYLGMDKEIGSLEAGKLADLIVMDENPLQDIRNSEKVKYVMINGRLYDSATLNEVGTREKLRGKLWFENGKTTGFTIPTGNQETWTYAVPVCD